MKKIIISLIIALTASFSASAVSYRGFFDVGYQYTMFSPIIPTNKWNERIEKFEKFDNFNISTTHGIQINRNLFIGAGVGTIIGLDLSEFGADVQIFGSIRYDLNIVNKWSPFININIGYYVYKNRYYGIEDFGYIKSDNKMANNYFSPDDFTHSPFYLNLNVGTRLKISSKFGFNFSLTYTPIFIHKNSSVYCRIGQHLSVPVEDGRINVKTGQSIGFNFGFDF